MRALGRWTETWMVRIDRGNVDNLMQTGPDLTGRAFNSADVEAGRVAAIVAPIIKLRIELTGLTRRLTRSSRTNDPNGAHPAGLLPKGAARLQSASRLVRRIKQGDVTSRRKWLQIPKGTMYL
jgi:hypothetical protein